MTIQQETSARKLHYQEPDVINYSDVHPHDPKKIIAFSAPAAPAPRRRGAQRMARRQKMLAALAAYARYACVILLMLFLYLRIAVFPEGGSAALHLLWIAAYALAGLSVLAVKTRLFVRRR